MIRSAVTGKNNETDSIKDTKRVIMKESNLSKQISVNLGCDKSLGFYLLYLIFILRSFATMECSGILWDCLSKNMSINTLMFADDRFLIQDDEKKLQLRIYTL